MRPLTNEEKQKLYDWIKQVIVNEKIIEKQAKEKKIINLMSLVFGIILFIAGCWGLIIGNADVDLSVTIIISLFFGARLILGVRT